MSNAPDSREPDEKAAAVDAPREPQPVVLAAALFGGCREVVILHDDVRYRLRITRKNKLILQK